MPAPAPAPAYTLTIAETARALRVDLRTAKTWAREGKIPATKTGGLWRVPVDALLRHLGEPVLDETRERLIESAQGVSGA